MHRVLPVLALSFLACSESPSSSPLPPATSSFEVVANPMSDTRGYREFDQYVDMNGIGIYGESGVSSEKLLYVAAVFAELLDNDEDGQWDDPDVFQELVDNKAIMPVFSREGSDGEDEFFQHYRGDGVSAVLYNGEVDPSQPGRWGYDATVEETLHTINHVGHVSVYPSAFDLSPGSSRLTEAMDVARGGQWIDHPGTYPEEAWYHYDDRTCDYECMAIEYLYWAIVSNMGILDDSQTCNGIANEWELCSPELFESGDVLMHALINDPTQLLPQIAPNGTYTPK